MARPFLDSPAFSAGFSAPFFKLPHILGASTLNKYRIIIKKIPFASGLNSAMRSLRSAKPVPSTRPYRPLLRRADQAVVAVAVFASLAAMGAYWVVQGGLTGELIEIDRAAPLSAKFLVDINQAAWPELAELPEIGPTLARRIVESRESAGPFADHDDLRRVRGIGPLTLERMKPYLLPMPGRGDVAGGDNHRAGAL